MVPLRNSFIIIIMFNKYKYSLNRGLINPYTTTKHNSNISTYALLSKNHPRSYELNLIKDHPNLLIMHNARQYMHKKFTYISQESNPNMINELKQELHFSNDNNLTVIIANQSSSCEQLVLGYKKQSSLLETIYGHLKQRKKMRSTINFSVLGIVSQNILTDCLKALKKEDENDDSNYLLLRFRRGEQKSYYLQNLTKKQINQEEDLKTQIKEYYYKKSYRESMVFKDAKNCDWPQAQLFIFTETENDPQYPSVQKVIKIHYLLKVNQYLKESSPILLKLGIKIRKKQQNGGKTIESNETRLFKLLGECFTTHHQYQIQIIYQLGYLPTLKEEYNNLVSLIEDKVSIRPSSAQQNIHEIPFLYVKNYNNYPHIFKIISKFQTSQLQHQTDSIIKNSKVRSKSYAYETLSSLEKKIVIDYPQIQEQYRREQNNLELFVQQTKNLYKQSDIFKNRSGNYKTYHNHNQNKPSLPKDWYKQMQEYPEAFRNTNINTKLNNRTNFSAKIKYNRQLLHSSHNKPKSIQSAEYKKYTSYNCSLSGKRIKNLSKATQLITDKPTTKYLLQEMVKKQILNFDKEDQLHIYDLQGNDVF